MAASQRLYRAIADEVCTQVQAERREYGFVHMNTVSLVIRIAGRLKADNPKFKYSVFYRACDLPQLIKSCECQVHQYEFASQADWSSEEVHPSQGWTPLKNK